MKLIKFTSLEKLGEKLTTEGPHKVEGTPRRVRGLLGGKYIFDTTASKYVWEHPYCTFHCSKSYIQSIAHLSFAKLSGLQGFK